MKKIGKKSIFALFTIILLGMAGFFSFAQAQEVLPEGGQNYSDAVKLEVKNYQYREENYDQKWLEGDQAVYYYFEGLKPGRMLKWTITNEAGAGLYMKLYDQDRKELVNVRNLEGIDTGSWLPSFSEGDHKYYFKLTPGFDFGDNDNGDPNFSLEFEKEDYFDAGTNKDAGEQASDALQVATGTYEGYFAGKGSGSDYKEYYQVSLERGEKLEVEATPSSDSGINLWLYNSDKEEEVWETSPNAGAVNRFSFIAVEAGDYYIRMDCTHCEHNIEEPMVPYEFEIAKEGVDDDILALRETGLSSGDIQTMGEELSEEEFEEKKNEILGTAEKSKELEEEMPSGEETEQMPSEEEMDDMFGQAEEKAEEAKRVFGFSVARAIWSIVKFIIYGLVALIVVGVVIFLLVKQSKSKKKK